MFNTFGKLLCAAVLASTALAQNVSIVLPAGNQLKTGSSIVVELEESVRVTHLGAVHGSSSFHPVLNR